MENNKVKKLNKGFTLFEMLIIVGIVSILSGVSFTYYNRFAEGRKLESEARKFANTLSLASKKTSSGDQVTCNSLSGYRVYVRSTGSQWYYDMQRCCGTNSSCDEELTDIATYIIPKNISITTPFVSTLLFKKIGRGLVINSNETIQNTTVTMKNNTLDNKNCVDININKAGVIEIGERADCS
jgi:Tfp pilus assembly protein FimT